MLTLLRLVVAATTPLSPDEAYYWVWSRAPATGYLDHPPMVAWFVACGTAIAGDTPLGVRLLAPLAAAAGSLVLARAANRLFPATRPGAAAALLLNATLMFGIGSVTMTPDTPLLLFWTGAVAVLAEMARRAGPAVPVGGTGRGKRPETVWRLGTLWRLGIAVGLALLSKYTAVLLAPAVLAWLAAPRNRRRWLADVRLWAAGVLALVLFAPVLVWNAEHGWASFAKQGGRTGDWNPGRAAQFLGELAGGQFGLATPLIAVLCTAGTVAMARRWREPACGLVAALTLVPAAVFAEHALGDRVQANWPAIVYPSAAVAAACLGGAWRRLRAPAVVLGFALTALVWLQGVAAPFPLPRSVDPTLARLGGWAALADAIAVRARRDGAAFVAADNYGQASLLAMLLPPSLPVLGVEDRWRFFNLPNAASPNAASPNAASPNAASPGAASPGAARVRQVRARQIRVGDGRMRSGLGSRDSAGCSCRAPAGPNRPTPPRGPRSSRTAPTRPSCGRAME